MLITDYARALLPRYTSYPPANAWHPATEADAVFARFGKRPLSLYAHVPFCRSLCYYCGCNMRVAHGDEVSDNYLEALAHEVGRVITRLPRVTPVVQLHLGGGTPTYLDAPRLERLHTLFAHQFAFAYNAELSVEVHPGVTSIAQLRALRFNRASIGVQDFDPAVQERVNRKQTFEQTRDLIAGARDCGYQGVNVDLMYGLPLQTVGGFERTLEQVLSLSPDRVALFGYAHVPAGRPHQKLLEADRPDAALRWALLDRGIERFLAAGYVHVGLDHFAKPGDPLAVAAGAGTLRRNFMGYTTDVDSDVLAFGPSAISEADGAFVQYESEVTRWMQRLRAGELAVARVHVPSADDDARRALIHGLFCTLSVDMHDRPSDEWVRIDALAADGLLEREGSVYHATPLGQRLLRHVAAVFDASGARGMTAAI